MICHLSDSFLAVTGQRDISPASGLLQSTVIKWIALYATQVAARRSDETGSRSGSWRDQAVPHFAADVTQLEMLSS